MGIPRAAIKKARTISPPMAPWPRTNATPSFKLLNMLPAAFSGRKRTVSMSSATMGARNERALSAKHQQVRDPPAGRPARGPGDPAAQRRSHRHRRIKLHGVQRDGIRHVLFWHQGWDQSGISWAAERLCKPDHEGACEEVPDLDNMEADQQGQDNGRAHLNALREDQHVTALEAIGQNAAYQREKKNRYRL